MRYIKRCENCLHEVRFPLDKGILLVTCPYCKHTFHIDPDDVSTYQDGRFDLSFQPSLDYAKISYSADKDKIKKAIVVFLFLLLFLNLYKSFGGFSNQSYQPEKQEEKTPPMESTPKEDEDLEFI